MGADGATRQGRGMTGGEEWALIVTVLRGLVLALDGPDSNVRITPKLCDLKLQQNYCICKVHSKRAQCESKLSISIRETHL